MIVSYRTSVLEFFPMYCPFCQNPSTRVVDSRVVDAGSTIRRRRECEECKKRFSTVERCLLLVLKRNGVTEEFSRDKVINGVRRACQGRDVSEDSLKLLAQVVEETVRSNSKGSSQVKANDIGLAILEPLRRLDEVAYLRFASVYRSFESAADFEKEIRRMRRTENRNND